ncbi:hypothetical protein MJO29_010249 [Puccinia striiformis f. sp. tritici]|nr:hypothetical protein Pst134EB_020210 [Puccinia striiformis f. sp. tritici]KAI7948584.1 hypothetical protein MJO29_010249 [Puccinia striiformis f. sp. tritici]
MNPMVSSITFVLFASATMAIPFGYNYPTISPFRGSDQYYSGLPYSPGFYGREQSYGYGGGYYPYNNQFQGYAPYGINQFSGSSIYGPGGLAYGRSVSTPGGPSDAGPSQVLGRATLGTTAQTAQAPSAGSDQSQDGQSDQNVQRQIQHSVGSVDTHGPMGVIQTQETTENEQSTPNMGA